MHALNYSLGLMSVTMRKTMAMRMIMTITMMSCSNHFNHLKQIVRLESYIKSLIQAFKTNSTIRIIYKIIDSNI